MSMPKLVSGRTGVCSVLIGHVWVTCSLLRLGMGLAPSKLQGLQVSEGRFQKSMSLSEWVGWRDVKLVSGGTSTSTLDKKALAEDRKLCKDLLSKNSINYRHLHDTFSVSPQL